MPKSLMNCVRKVKKKGHDESSSYAICSKSTGWAKKKGGGWKNKKTNSTFNESLKFDKFINIILENIKKK